MSSRIAKVAKSAMRRGLARDPSGWKEGSKHLENRAAPVSSSAGTLPWGSLPSPDFGRIRKETNISPEQMDSLVRQHLPNESVDVCRQRNKVVRVVHRLMRQKKSKELEQELEKLESNVVPLDEVTYVTLLFGNLILPHRGLSAADSVLAQMRSVDHMHPALIDFVSSFLSSLHALDKFDAFPNRTAILKALLPFQEVAADMRRVRMLGFRVAMSEGRKSPSPSLDLV